jgi:hypothetical protein
MQRQTVQFCTSCGLRMPLTATRCHISVPPVQIVESGQILVRRATFDHILDGIGLLHETGCILDAALNSTPTADGRTLGGLHVHAARATDQRGPGELKRGKWLACGVVVGMPGHRRPKIRQRHEAIPKKQPFRRHGPTCGGQGCCLLRDPEICPETDELEVETLHCREPAVAFVLV